MGMGIKSITIHIHLRPDSLFSLHILMDWTALSAKATIRMLTVQNLNKLIQFFGPPEFSRRFLYECYEQALGHSMILMNQPQGSVEKDLVHSHALLL